MLANGIGIADDALALFLVAVERDADDRHGEQVAALAQRGVAHDSDVVFDDAAGADLYAGADIAEGAYANVPGELGAFFNDTV